MNIGFTEHRHQALRYFTAPALLRAGCRHCFTALDTSFRLPIGGKMAENPSYRLLAGSFGVGTDALRFSQQVHEADICIHREEGSPRSAIAGGVLGFRKQDNMPFADGHVTDVPGLVLLTFHADCVPVYLYDPVRRAVGMLHSGWRGTARNIAARGVAAMEENYGTLPRELLAAVGPCICERCFETDADVPDAMRARYGAAADSYIRRQGDKYHVDMQGLIVHALRACGVPDEGITLSGLCTCCRADLFWSHRRQGNERGVMVGAIGLV